MAIKKEITNSSKGSAEPVLKLVEEDSNLPEVYKKIILALESTAVHPMAEAFRLAFKVSGSLPPVGNYKNTAGVGVSGYIYGKYYSLGRDPSTNIGSRRCVLSEDERIIFRFRFHSGGS